MKCALCKAPLEELTLEGHIKKHITDSYQKEVEAFHETQAAVAYYKKIFKEEP